MRNDVLKSEEMSAYRETSESENDNKVIARKHGAQPVVLDWKPDKTLYETTERQSDIKPRFNLGT